MPVRRRPNPLSFLAVVLVFAGLIAMAKDRLTGNRPAGERPLVECDRSIDPLCAASDATPEQSTQMLAAGVEAPVIPAAEVCPRAAYLCAEIDLRGFVDVHRWRDHTGPVVVHIPLPDFESVSDARRLQAAANAGVRAWNGQPFPISVDLTGEREADFSVAWYRSLGGQLIGRARTSWSPQTGLRVIQLDLATRSPHSRAVIGPQQIRLTAAHEMGHALGLLMHSDQRRDVMYPSNTANSLTSRDYRSMEALYELPDGARISR